MSHIYIDGIKITANANKGNDRLLPRYNIQQCKQKNTETHFFVNLGFLICCFFTAPFVERMMGIEPTHSAKILKKYVCYLLFVLRLFVFECMLIYVL